MRWGYEWRPYVPVAQRRAKAMAKMEKLRKKGVDVQPVRIEGRTIAHTFWGKAWCEHLEKFSDFANRLPRGRTYVRNGSVCHLDIAKGRIEAKISGSEIYDIAITIKELPKAKWEAVKRDCGGQVGTLLELLQGKLSQEVMQVVTDREKGLFPQPREIDLDCSCPDWADMCKHVAAVMYGVGARLDRKPELLFLLRGVDHTELVGQATAQAVVAKGATSKARVLRADQLGEVFGIEMVPEAAPPGTAGSLPGVVVRSLVPPARDDDASARNDRDGRAPGTAGSPPGVAKRRRVKSAPTSPAPAATSRKNGSSTKAPKTRKGKKTKRKAKKG